MVKKFTKTVFISAAIIILLALLINLRTHFIGKFFYSTIYDSIGTAHFLKCDELPDLIEVEMVVNEHQDLVDEILQVNPGIVTFKINSPCPGKGAIYIEYPSHNNRVIIEELIGDDTFFGIPFTGINY